MNKLFSLTLLVVTMMLVSFTPDIGVDSKVMGMEQVAPQTETFNADVELLKQITPFQTTDAFNSVCFCTSFNWETMMYKRQYMSGSFPYWEQYWCWNCPAPPIMEGTDECIPGCGY
jgi:hypothetical protein